MDSNDQIIPENNFDSEPIVLNLDPQQRKKTIRRWPFFVLAILLTVVALVVVFWHPIVELFRREDEQKTIQDYELQEFGEFTDSFIKSYSSFLSSDEAVKSGTKCHIEVDIEQLALKVIEKDMPDLAVLGKLNDLSLDFAVENDGNKYRAYLTAEHETADLPGVELQLDPELGKLFLILPGLTEDYLQFELSDLMKTAEQTGKHWDASNLPSAEQVEAFLYEYFENFVDLMNEQSIKEEIVSVDGVKQTCSVYTAEVQLKDFWELNMNSVDKLIGLGGVDAELLEKLVKRFEELEQDMAEEEFNQSLIWSIYVDEKGNIIGRKILVGDSEVLDYLLVTNNGEFAVCLKLGQIEISGSGSIEDYIVDGDIVLAINSEKHLEFKLKDVLIEDYEKGKLSGTVEIEFSDKLCRELFDSNYGLPMEFEVKFKVVEQDYEFVISYMDMVAFTIDVTQYTPEQITLPNGEAIDGDSSDAMYRFLKNIDVFKLTNELKKAGLTDLFD